MLLVERGKMLKRIFLTGGNGFIGRNIREKLDGKYTIFSPSSWELDLLDREAVTKYLKQNKISDVIHSAVYNQKRRGKNPDADFSSNMKMFFHLAEHSHNLDKIIYFGSGAEFDKSFPIHRVTEQDFGQKIPLLNDYGLSKYLINLQARQSENIYNLRLFGVYGPHEDWRTCFISNLCCKAIYGLPLTIRQECVFDFLCVDDLMQPICDLLDSTPLHHDYNLCTGKPVHLTEIAEIVREISGKDLEIQILNPGENLEYTGLPERFEKEYGLTMTGLQQGIERLYHFYENCVDKIDFEILKQTR